MERVDLKAAIIGASSEALHTIELAKQLGLNVVAFDGNPTADGLNVADEAIVVDISQEDATIEAVKKEVVDFVLTVPIGRYLTTIGAVNDALELPGITKAMASKCTDKYLFHKTLQEKQLRACNCYCLPEEKAEEYILQYPAILKPRFGSGSRGIHYLENEKQLRIALEQIGEEDYVLEECMDGEEYGMDAAVIGGTFYMILLRKKDNTPLPNRQAVAYYSVWEEDSFYEPACAYMKRVVDVLGLSECLLHADLIKGKNGPFAIEVSARPSGHNLHNLFTPMASGVDVAKEYICCRMGKEYSFVPSEKRHLSIHYFDMEGVVKHIPTQKEMEETGADVKKWVCNLTEGEKLGSVSDGHSIMGRGYFILEKNKKEEPAKQALMIKQLFAMGR